ncbi:alpha/beta fold hydrolase [Sphingomonas sp. PB4P5]|uniref:alpha/beta fold hydrolase n=1 Tax=Parasphingomonas puruogangriensis TaxID=3096155 RepID=UPI002FCA62EC
MTIDIPTLGTPRFLEVAGGRIAYDDTDGDGPLLLAIPGMGDLRAEYRHLRPFLVAAGYRVVTMDVRGFGETTAGWDDYSARAVGQDAVALIEALGMSDTVILGNSFAAGSALWAARESPSRVRGVVLLGPIVRDLEIAPTVMLALQVGFGGPWRHEFWTAYWDALFVAHRPADHADYRALLLANIREEGRMDALMAMLTLSKAETTSIVGESNVPALIVMGSRDPDFDDPVAEAERLATTLNARNLIVESVGHYPHVEAPERVAAAIASFVGSLPVVAAR